MPSSVSGCNQTSARQPSQVTRTSGSGVSPGGISGRSAASAAASAGAWPDASTTAVSAREPRTGGQRIGSVARQPHAQPRVESPDPRRVARQVRRQPHRRPDIAPHPKPLRSSQALRTAPGRPAAPAGRLATPSPPDAPRRRSRSLPPSASSAITTNTPVAKCETLRGRRGGRLRREPDVRACPRQPLNQRRRRRASSRKDQVHAGYGDTRLERRLGSCDVDHERHARGARRRCLLCIRRHVRTSSARRIAAAVAERRRRCLSSVTTPLVTISGPAPGQPTWWRGLRTQKPKKIQQITVSLDEGRHGA